MTSEATHRTRVRPAPEPPSPASVDSRRLLGSEGQLLIEHRGRLYQLRETRNGKLILTG
ncbi:hemin uptake protein HemP [Halomonas mongoliensis]|jgi:hemin uptake protein HemP|uniref:Hemin uptake protein HemP n=1 Tax=Halomonas mongoliensis TaxID=321265 RepID=A0ABU1GP19_9GAMM|nr:hemin uptake protein HemP [Halomonas mongoliensis]MDR5893775.1 hemin uptake protein HemP [Halomonas mongoliensis]